MRAYKPLTLPLGLLCWLCFAATAGDAFAQTPTATATETETETTPPPPFTQELARVQNLVRANVLELAQDILETQGPPPQPTPEWLRWERQLWAVYRVRGRWQTLYERTRRLPRTFPPPIQREARLQAIKALTALKRGSAARDLIRKALPETDAPPTYKRQLRQSLIAAYLADDLLVEARIALDNFQKDYGSQQTDWLLLSAAVRIRSGDADAAVNLLAPLDAAAARLLRLYARLINRTLTPDQVIVRARDLRASLQGRGREPKRGEPPARDIQAVLAQAQFAAGNRDGDGDSRVVVLEDYLLAPPVREPDWSGVYPQFGVRDLFDAYADIARDQANRAGLLVGEEKRWFEHARALPATAAVARRALFAHLAATADTATATGATLRQRAIDAYVNSLIDAERTALLAHLFGHDADARLGNLSLGGQTGLRLSAYALGKGDFTLAAEANANLLEFPAGVNRNDWLLQAGRIDIFAGRHRRGAERLDEWLASFSPANRMSAAQTDAVLQPLFDLQTVGRHQLALALLHKVNARAPAGKHAREIAYWLAESYAGGGQYITAADWFLHSALQRDGGFDKWGEAARYRAAEALMDGALYADAGRLLRGLLSRATTDARRNALRQKLQRVWLLESNPDDHDPQAADRP